jgi:integrase
VIENNHVKYTNVCRKFVEKMATFKAVVRSHHQRRDGKYPVSIRLTHNRESVYLPTGLYVSKKQINTKYFELKDQFVIERTNETIRTYENSLLEIATDELLEMSAKELVLRISKKHSEIEFISFARELQKDKTFKSTALPTVFSILESMGYTTLMLRQIDSIFVTQFVRKMESIELPATKQKGETRTKKYSSGTKNKIMIAFRSAFNRAIENVEEGRRYKYARAFDEVKLYKKEAHVVDSVPVPLIRKFFSITYDSPLQEMTKDMLMLSFCLGGMNLGDMLLMKKSNYRDGRITYFRNKIKENRADGGLTSIKVEPEIQDLFDKYTALSNSEYLFNFNGMRWIEGVSSRNFGMTVDRMCKLKGLPHITPYQFRHSVGTIGRNKCGFSRDDVGMLLNHRGQTTIDDAYIDYDWSLNDKINRAILDYVFHSDKE